MIEESGSVSESESMESVIHREPNVHYTVNAQVFDCSDCLESFLGIPFQQTKEVAENCSNEAAFPLPIHLCAPCVLCGSPPLPNPETFRCGPMGLSDGLQLT